ncbi:YpdA family putative bacillithiol disulfide reductase [Paenibacillus thalictri]|uniref:YpdA family putative bacillithiol disulfide reductase n=1 Tax=Paenibacillus thalictri TaxID=2527873 RepID=A0A4Q9DX64_9BACL|nr:YpdA family putative bacillithiol disulfide reductase [Paenibacillus thalictri]TBL80357.1 YpdA family putative bacillithiol disulfide reductase [Paenibacillus thalictri]
MEEVIIVGAGPCGLSAAAELHKRGFKPLLLEKHAIVHSIYLYPTYMQFFSTPELLEIGGIPFTTPHEKPNRQEALSYYRKVAHHYGLRIHAYQEVTGIAPSSAGFEVIAADRSGSQIHYNAKNVVVSTGYFDHPNMLGIPGEELPKVSHYFREAHPYTGTEVAIIGGNNSAVDAALELTRAGASVTIVYRGEGYSPSIKPWVRPIFESMVTKGKIRMLFNSRVEAIGQRQIVVSTGGAEMHIDNDFVLALTGFKPDRNLLSGAGVAFQGEYGLPVFDDTTMETNVPGLYIAGVIASGMDANEVFIETGRYHGVAIAEHIASNA